MPLIVAFLVLLVIVLWAQTMKFLGVQLSGARAYLACVYIRFVDVACRTRMPV